MDQWKSLTFQEEKMSEYNEIVLLRMTTTPCNSYKLFCGSIGIPGGLKISDIYIS